DRLLGMNNVEVFDQQIRNSRAVILKDIGHLPMAEAPAKAADALRRFWQEADTQAQHTAQQLEQMANSEALATDQGTNSLAVCPRSDGRRTGGVQSIGAL